MTENRSNRRATAERNVGRVERWASGVAGVALLAYGLRRRRGRPIVVPLGVGLLRRAVTGRCEINRALGRNSARPGPAAGPYGGDVEGISHAVTVYRPREEVFRFWRRFDNLPRFMDNLESVTILDDRRSHWVAKGTLGTRVGWDVEIQAEIPNVLIEWRSVEGSEVEQAGSVRFSHATGDTTHVHLFLRGNDPSRRIADDLRRFKQVMEAGDVPLPTTSPSR
jgi:uncharacterized membrane protein